MMGLWRKIAHTIIYTEGFDVTFQFVNTINCVNVTANCYFDSQAYSKDLYIMKDG